MRYEKPEMEVVELKSIDIVTVSGGDNGSGPDWDFGQ